MSFGLANKQLFKLIDNAEYWAINLDSHLIFAIVVAH